MKIIARHAYLRRIETAFRVHPVVSILGPRQCGKSTLARMYCDHVANEYFDLEDPVDRRRLEAPMQALKPLRGLVVLDEIQRKPELFEILRVLADRPGSPARFLILGSASPRIVRGVSETLAGRVGFIDLAGFGLAEIDVSRRRTLWLRGGFPRSFLAADEADSYRWRTAFIRTFLERDIPQLGIGIPAETLRRFWTMMAHYHGQTWNAAELARSIGSSEPTARRYLDILSGAYMVRVLPPWFANTGKRQVKAPRIYLRDSGLLHALLELETRRDVESHPRMGASWEGFALEQTLEITNADNAYYWSSHGGAEVDLMVHSHGRRYGFEFKHADAPGGSRSMYSALKMLELERLWVIYPGEKSYPISERITALPLALLSSLQSIFME
jgi:uncharacterized protein